MVDARYVRGQIGLARLITSRKNLINCRSRRIGGRLWRDKPRFEFNEGMLRQIHRIGGAKNPALVDGLNELHHFVPIGFSRSLRYSILPERAADLGPAFRGQAAGGAVQHH